MMVGFGRVAANETLDLRLQQLDIADPKSVNLKTIAEALLRFCASVRLEDEKRALWTLESEILLEANRQQKIRRIEHVQELNDRYNSDSRAVILHLDPSALTTPVALQYQPEDGTFIVKEVPRSMSDSVSHSPSIELLTIHSTLSAIKTAGDFRFLVLGTHLATGKNYLSLVSTPVANVLTVTKEQIVPLPDLPDGISKTRFLRSLCSHLLATEVLHSFYAGQTIVAHNTHVPISEALYHQAKAKGINVIYTTDISEEAGIPDSWIRMPPYLVESDIAESSLPARLSAFIGFSSHGTTSLDNEARLIEYLAETCQHFTQAKNLYSRTASNSRLVPENLLASTLNTVVNLIRPEDIIAQPGVDNPPTSEHISLDELLSIGAKPDNPFDVIVDWISTSYLPIHVTRLDSKPLFKGKDSTY
ncbi:hypothetical protein E0Z10_g3338 [Xylaria hypoxylon]|uniref:Uncharacterized protein n=1 Tax=Xylaria hypoxylon TaxID=37992 RepID=A0A4Z0Z1M2_9PEZI|nr:hypothetical protein E0Z10_g3338 [Xylaria hypoxylon]